MHVRRLTPIAFGLLALTACATTGAPSTEKLPLFDDHEARLFDDGLDLVENPDGVGGYWQEEWARELDQRVARASLVAVGTVHTLRTDHDLEQRTSYRLIFRAEDVLKGETPEADLTLSSDERSRGYTSVENARDDLLNARFIVFASRFRDVEGNASLHWHLSPASDGVLKGVRERVASEAPTFREVKVIERRD